MPRDEKGQFFDLYAGDTDFFTIDWGHYDLVDDAETIVAASSQWTLISGSGLTKLSDSQAARTTTIQVQAAGSTVESSEHLWQNRILTSNDRELFRYLRIKIAKPVDNPVKFSALELKELRKAYYQGVTRVRYGTGADQKEVEYRSLEDMRQLLDEMDDTLSGTTTSPSCSLVSHRRG